jgi:acyl carrier protein
MWQPQSFLVAVVVAVVGCNSNVEPAKSPNNQAAPEATENVVRAVLSELLYVDSAAIPMDTPISAPPLKADDVDLAEIADELEQRLGVVISDDAIEWDVGKLGKRPIRITPNQLVRIAREAPKAQQPKRKK